MISAWIKVKVVYGANKSFDITDRVEVLKYVSSVKKDNTVELTIVKDYARELADESRIITANVIVFSWGIAGGKSSPVIRMKISDVEPKYAERVSLTIRGTDMGNTAKKTTSNNVDKIEESNQFITRILVPFAEMYNLTPVFDKTEIEKYFDPKTIGAQAHYSNYSWLKKIANKNGFMCFIDNKKLIFKKRDLKKSAYRKFTYNDGEGDLISFLPKFRESTEESAAGGVQVAAVNPLTGETQNNTSANNQDSLGKKINKYDSSASFAGVDGGKKPTVSEADYNDFKKVIVAPSSDSNQGMADKLNQDSMLAQHTASLNTLGDPSFFADTIVTIANVDRRNSGNWYAETVTHTVAATGAYVCVSELVKNGSSEPTKANAADASGNVNKTTGPENGVRKKTVPLYDSNSNRKQ